MRGRWSHRLLLLLDRNKRAIGIDEQPERATEDAEDGRGQIGSGPTIMRGDGRSGDGGNGAAGFRPARTFPLGSSSP